MLAILLSLALLLNNPTAKYLYFWLYIAFSLAWILNDAGLLYPWLWSGPLHHFDAMLFFPFQCLFMDAHLYNRERRREREAENRQAQLSLSQQREADRRVHEVEESERRRIAQNMHDEIGSMFAAIRYRLLSMKQKRTMSEVYEDMERIGQLSEQGMQRQYSIIDDLLFEIR
jgi:signal transduction histidine kinase